MLKYNINFIKCVRTLMALAFVRMLAVSSSHSYYTLH